jgi:conjugative transposon protein traI
MKKTILICIGIVLSLGVKAQIPVTDGANITQSIVNSIQQIFHTSTTAENMINNFKETVKLYEQGKQYYDALKSVSNLIKDARKVQKTILLVGEISDIFVTNYQRMLTDKNFSVRELEAISFGYTRLLQEATDLLLELKIVIKETTLSMTDKERFDLIDRVYRDVKHYRNLVYYYTRKNISVSFLRARKKNDTDRVLQLYGTASERYW